MQIKLDDLLHSSETTLTSMVKILNNQSPIALSTLESERTALVIVDMINGFVKDGALASPRIQVITPTICQLLSAFNSKNMISIAFADSHLDDCIEFQSFPPHCLSNTTESEIIGEIQDIGGYELILKNSTNGFLEDQFQTWLSTHQDITQFIIVGDCTDICIEQFSITLKTHFNKINQESRIIVPISGVQTYDADTHPGDFMHVVALYKMMLSGIEIASEIEL
ncbi:MAG: cysteine hydrolase family protein [Turicibacter sp.]